MLEGLKKMGREKRKDGAEGVEIEVKLMIIN